MATDHPPRTAGQEWRRYGMVPVAGALGYAVMQLQTYGVGPFVPALEEEFGWSRAQIMTGLTISMAVGVLGNFAVGVLADRVGPRRVGLIGMALIALAYGLQGTATGTMLNWSLIWLFIAVAVALTQAFVWTSAVASRFDKGRGLAIAITLSGSSLCAATVPVAATWLTGLYGWRVAYWGVAGIWFAVAFPFVLFFFRGEQDEARRARKAKDKAAAPLETEIAQAPVELPGMGLREGLRRPAFWRLAIATVAFAFYTMAIAANLVPMLIGKGANALQAAQIASLVGVIGLIARVSTGALLDRLPANVLGTFVFLLPVAGCALMLIEDPGLLILALGVISFGITIGAEYDIVFYLVSRHFGLRFFAAMMGGVLTFGSISATIAPVVSGWLYDEFGNYDVLLMLLMGLMAMGAIAIATMGRGPDEYARAGH